MLLYFILIYALAFIKSLLRFQFIRVTKDGSAIYIHHVSHEPWCAAGRPSVFIGTAYSKFTILLSFTEDTMRSLLLKREFFLIWSVFQGGSVICDLKMNILQFTFTVLLTMSILSASYPGLFSSSFGRHEQRPQAKLL